MTFGMCRTGTTLLTIAQIHLVELGGAVVTGLRGTVREKGSAQANT
jgi:hypothetical protein